MEFDEDAVKQLVSMVSKPKLGSEDQIIQWTLELARHLDLIGNKLKGAQKLRTLQMTLFQLIELHPSLFVDTKVFKEFVHDEVPLIVQTYLVGKPQTRCMPWCF